MLLLFFSVFLFCCKLTYSDPCAMSTQDYEQAEIQSRHYYFNETGSVWPCNKNPRLTSCQRNTEAERSLSTSSTFSETRSHSTLITDVFHSRECAGDTFCALLHAYKQQGWYASFCLYNWINSDLTGQTWTYQMNHNLKNKALLNHSNNLPQPWCIPHW